MRLIDVDDAINKINDLCVDSNENWIGTDNQSFVDHSEVIDILCDAPTVDAVPVEHGRWIPEGIGEKCSVCGATIVIEQYDGEMNCCMNCFAKMDGGNEDA